MLLDREEKMARFLPYLKQKTKKQTSNVDANKKLKSAAEDADKKNNLMQEPIEDRKNN
jgi:hypothetical protein